MYVVPARRTCGPSRRLLQEVTREPLGLPILPLSSSLCLSSSLPPLVLFLSVSIFIFSRKSVRGRGKGQKRKRKKSRFKSWSVYVGAAAV